jgi:hypothetical protein
MVRPVHKYAIVPKHDAEGKRSTFATVLMQDTIDLVSVTLTIRDLVFLVETNTRLA